MILAPPSIACSTTSGDLILYDNQFIYSPTSQLYAAGMRNNRFGVYNAYGYNNVTSSSLWTASQSSYPIGSVLTGQSDANIVVYTSRHGVLWASNTNIGGGPVFCLQMLDSGNLIWTDTSNTVIWETNTAVSGR